MPNEGRAVFTKEMKKTHTILIPNMLPIHMRIMKPVLKGEGYNVKLLENRGPGVVTEGLKNVHNDTCYPALIVIGQMLDALNGGGYDPKTTAFMLTQTGGGCRASNYIALLKKALKKSGFPDVPIISLNAGGGLEKSPGFSLSPLGWLKMLWSLSIGDFLMLIYNQCRPYEIFPGSSDKTLSLCIDMAADLLTGRPVVTHGAVKAMYKKILRLFGDLPRHDVKKPRVGVVGEIYVKYSPIGNNDLESFLISEGAEVVVPGVLDFLMYCCHNSVEDQMLYLRGVKNAIVGFASRNLLEHVQRAMIKAVAKFRQREGRPFFPPTPFKHVRSLAARYIGRGVKMGEGWLLTGEMAELLEQGVSSIVCTQPFGCLPNHIAGKGMLRALRNKNPEANIVAVDYDPGASAVNQQNRIKLMLSRAVAKPAPMMGRGQEQAEAGGRIAVVAMERSAV